MLFLLLCNRRTLLQLKENIEWENCAGLDLWCQQSLPGYNSDSDSRHPFKSHSMKDAGWCWHSSVSPIIVVLRIVNIATSGTGVCELYQIVSRLRLAWWQLLATRTLYTGRVFLTVSRYLWRWDMGTEEPWPWVAPPLWQLWQWSWAEMPTQEHLSLLLFLELDLNLNKKCQFPVIIPLFTVHVQGNKNLNTIETLDSKYKTFCEGFINVTGNSHWKYKLVI